MAKALLAVIFCLCASLATGPVLAASAPKKPPTWPELTQEQKTILEPLAADWDKLDPRRKFKWLGIAKRYPAMKPAEQEKVQKNMQPWARLTPEQRNAARERYKNLSKLPPDKKLTLREQYEEYLKLPEEEREKLRAQAKARKSATVAPHPAPPAPPAAQSSVPQPAPSQAAAVAK